jgi:mitochondrial import inner membrane translocase subunit TIM13
VRVRVSPRALSTGNEADVYSVCVKSFLLSSYCCLTREGVLCSDLSQSAYRIVRSAAFESNPTAMSYDGYDGGGGGGGPTREDAEAAMDRLQAEVAQEQMQGLVEAITDKCFAKCVTKPSSSLSGAEHACLARCQDRYVDCMTVVYNALARQAQRSAEGVGGL